MVSKDFFQNTVISWEHWRKSAVTSFLLVEILVHDREHCSAQGSCLTSGYQQGEIAVFSLLHVLALSLSNPWLVHKKQHFPFSSCDVSAVQYFPLALAHKEPSRGQASKETCSCTGHWSEQAHQNEQ